MSRALRAIRIRCQRPGCQVRTTLALGHLDEIGRRAGVSRIDSASGTAASMMLMIAGWGYSVDPDGVLYGVCPADTAGIRISPEAGG
jgi:hypothetical protein